MSVGLELRDSIPTDTMPARRCMVSCTPCGDSGGWSNSGRPKEVEAAQELHRGDSPVARVRLAIGGGAVHLLV